MRLKSSEWVGIHMVCGGIIRAKPNISARDSYLCPVNSCTDNILEDESYVIFKNEDLPPDIYPTHIKNLDRGSRQKIAREESELNRINMVKKLVGENDIRAF